MWNKVALRSKGSGKRPLEPVGDNDMACGLEVCDELNEGNAHVDSTVARERVQRRNVRSDTLARRHGQSTSTGDGVVQQILNEEVTDETCSSGTGRQPISFRREDINKRDGERAEVRSRLIAREIKHNS